MAVLAEPSRTLSSNLRMASVVDVWRLGEWNSSLAICDEPGWLTDSGRLEAVDRRCTPIDEGLRWTGSSALAEPALTATLFGGVRIGCNPLCRLLPEEVGISGSSDVGIGG